MVPSLSPYLTPIAAYFDGLERGSCPSFPTHPFKKLGEVASTYIQSAAVTLQLDRLPRSGAEAIIRSHVYGRGRMSAVIRNLGRRLEAAFQRLGGALSRGNESQARTELRSALSHLEAFQQTVVNAAACIRSSLEVGKDDRDAFVSRPAAPLEYAAWNALTIFKTTLHKLLGGSAGTGLSMKLITRYMTGSGRKFTLQRADMHDCTTARRAAA